MNDTFLFVNVPLKNDSHSLGSVYNLYYELSLIQTMLKLNSMKRC